MRHRKSKSSNTGSQLSQGSNPAGSQCPKCGGTLTERDWARPGDGGSRAYKVGCLTRESKDVPMLRLSGKWLALAGFEIGKHIQIDVQQGRLTIMDGTKAEDPSA